MPDREKVICAIQHCINVPKCRDCPWEECEGQHVAVDGIPLGLMRDALALLKEQEPKTVVVEDMPEGESWFGIWFGRCPNCNEQLVKKEHKHFCGHCGKAVKWND